MQHSLVHGTNSKYVGRMTLKVSTVIKLVFIIVIGMVRNFLELLHAHVVVDGQQNSSVYLST